MKLFEGIDYFEGVIKLFEGIIKLFEQSLDSKSSTSTALMLLLQLMTNSFPITN